MQREKKKQVAALTRTKSIGEGPTGWPVEPGCFLVTVKPKQAREKSRRDCGRFSDQIKATQGLGEHGNRLRGDNVSTQKTAQNISDGIR